MTFSVYRAIWSCLHLLYSAAQFVEYLWLIFRRKCEEFVYQESLRNEFEFISEHVRVLDKIPSHLVIIVGNETISFKDLTNISVWCIAAGISFLSFYDHKGVIKKNETALLKAISLYRSNFVNNITLGNRKPSSGVTHGTKQKNGVSPLKRLHVNFFTITDGKGGIVTVTRNICKLVESGKLKPSEITQDLLTELIQTEVDVPDPELAIYCGGAFSTFGFLPWQIRVTEFAHLETHHNVSVVQFVSLLRQYGQCQQRFGK